MTKYKKENLYYKYGDTMKLYLDVIFFTNFLFDFILLLCVSIVLRKNTKIYRLLLGSLFGSITLLSLFIRMTNFELFLLKIIMSMVMILITFPFKGIKVFVKDLSYLYIVSIFCGGGVYFLYNQLGYKQEGLVFLKNGYHLNFIILIIMFFVSVYIYVRQSKDLRRKVSSYHTVDIYYKNRLLSTCHAYLDTGNNLYDPYLHRPICLFYTKKEISVEKPIYVEYKTVTSKGLLLCFFSDKIVIDKEKVYKKQLIGLVKEKFSLDGVDFILHRKLEGKE